MRSATTSLLFVATAGAAAFAVACVTAPAAPAVITPRLSPAASQAKLVEADELAARGCYICLLEAAKDYALLAEVGAFTDASGLLKKTLENDLMLALREIELRIPDSGARARALGLRGHVTGYDTHFALLTDLPRDRAARLELISRLQPQTAVSAVTAYYLLDFGFKSTYWTPAELKTEPQKIAAMHPANAALKYRLISYQPTFDRAMADEILSLEPRFAEVRLVTGTRELYGANLLGARRAFLAAYETLPQSLTIKTAMATIEFAFARYAQALALLDELLAAEPDASLQLTRAQTLSYLKRHHEAIAELNGLLKDVRNNPGVKYYWRAWNELQLAELPPAYEDATTALKFMIGVDAQRLAGIASFNLERLVEARGYFEEALKLSAEDCDSLQYLGQLDAAEKKWPAAATRFTSAAACFEGAIEKGSAELAKKEAANADGLLDGQIAGVKEDIAGQRVLQAQSVQNAAVAARNVLPPRTPAR